MDAQAWNEIVSYVDCPHCKKTIELGSELHFSKKSEEDCPYCSETFTIIAPKRDYP